MARYLYLKLTSSRENGSINLAFVPKYVFIKARMLEIEINNDLYLLLNLAACHLVIKCSEHLFFFFFFRAIRTAYGSSQARG